MQEINRRYANTSEYARMKNGEIFPTNTAPVITMIDKQVQACLFTWGFPGWQEGGVIINARSETVAEKAMFRQAFVNRRCVIPATGFYEWQKVPGKKKKDRYLFSMPDTPVLYMAGLYSVYEQDGIKLPSFVILTTAANLSVQPIHNRMPVILEKHEQETWLKDAGFARHIIERQGPRLKALPVLARIEN